MISVAASDRDRVVVYVASLPSLSVSRRGSRKDGGDECGNANLIPCPISWLSCAAFFWRECVYQIPRASILAECWISNRRNRKFAVAQQAVLTVSFAVPKIATLLSAVAAYALSAIKGKRPQGDTVMDECDQLRESSQLLHCFGPLLLSSP